MQITIKTLKKIIEDAESLRKHDASLSETIELFEIKESQTHCGEGFIKAILKSNYAECVGSSLFFKQE